MDSSPENATKALESIAAKRRDFALLVAAYERRAAATTDGPRQIDALRTAAHYAQLVNDPSVLVRIQRQLLAHDPRDREASLTLLRYYEEQNDPTGLVEVLRSRLASTDDQAEVADLLRRIAHVSEEGARDVVAAVDAYQKLLELQPDQREALDALARIFESTERWSEFIENHAAADSHYHRPLSESADVFPLRLGHRSKVRTRRRRDSLLRPSGESIGLVCRPCTGCATSTCAARTGRGSSSHSNSKWNFGPTTKSVPASLRKLV